jgi:hypothetical protein
VKIRYSRQAAESLLMLRNPEPFVRTVADEIKAREMTLIEALGEFGPFGAG